MMLRCIDSTITALACSFYGCVAMRWAGLARHSPRNHHRINFIVFRENEASSAFAALKTSYNARGWGQIYKQGTKMNGLGTSHSSSAIGTLTKSWGNGAPVRRSDLQLLRRAICQGWPIPPNVIADVKVTLRGIVNDDNASDRLVNGAVQTFILMEQVGLAHAKSQRAPAS